MPSYVNKEFKQNLDFIKDCYCNNIQNEPSSYFSLVTSPFKVLKLKNVICAKEKKDDLYKSVVNVKLHRLNNDLYRLSQSEDLTTVELKPIQNFINVLKTEIGPILSEVCNVKLNNKLTITASLYQQGDVLLCHDDKCYDRCIAFVYYLTGSDNDGGSFDMFAHDESYQPTEVTYSIPPEENSFICFEVGNLTYHQVSEVTSENFNRYSINGWFHSDRELPPLLEYEEFFQPNFGQIQSSESTSTNHFINPLYCLPSNINKIREEFEEKSYGILMEIFNVDLLETWLRDIKSDEITWQMKGPANRRHYYEALVTSLPTSFSDLTQYLMSPLFISYLKSITGFDEEEDNFVPEVNLELIKWSSCCYTMATDNDNFFKRPGLDLYIFFSSPNSNSVDDTCGTIVYIDTAESDDEDNIDDAGKDSQLLVITPQDNMMALVYRDTGSSRFTKYLDQFTEDYYAIYATYYFERMDDSTDRGMI